MQKKMSYMKRCCILNRKIARKQVATESIQLPPPGQPAHHFSIQDISGSHFRNGVQTSAEKKRAKGGSCGLLKG